MTPAEAGLQAIAKFANTTLSAEELGTFRWPKCLVCGQRPTMLERPNRFLIFITGLADPKIVTVPRYDILPCCSARYVKENEGLSKRQKRQVMEQLKERKGV